MTATPLPALDGSPVYTINRWQYESAAGAGFGTCRLRIWEAPGTGIVAVVTELDDNPGASITNSAEQIIGALRALYPGYEVTVFEHYPAIPGSTLKWRQLDRIDWVYLDVRRPVWKPVWPVAEICDDFITRRLWMEMYGEQITATQPAAGPGC